LKRLTQTEHARPTHTPRQLASPVRGSPGDHCDPAGLADPLGNYACIYPYFPDPSIVFPDQVSGLHSGKGIGDHIGAD